MNHNLLLLCSIITSSMITGMEITHTSSSQSKTTIFISHAMHKNRNISIKLDRDGILSMNSKTKGPHKSSPQKNKIDRYEKVT